MTLLIKIFYESVIQAFNSLTANKLRTFLSLLGITIGIFCIIAVKSAVDSLESGILSGFNELGSDVIYIEKMPWNEDPNQNYWKYAKRPDPDYEDFEKLEERVKSAESTVFSIFTGGRTIKYKSSSVSGAFIMGSTYDLPSLNRVVIGKGRYFTPVEHSQGSNKVILGYEVASELFGNIEPVGKYVKLFGQKFLVIGITEEEGENMFNFIDYDDVIWISYHTAKKFINVKDNRRVGHMLGLKAKPNVSLEDLKDETTGILRSHRRLKPTEESNFSINEISMLGEVLDKVFGVMNIAGFIIGVFALIVGMFSVANIMFVSVKERTNIIGIKKALGAKRNIILLEFLIEAVILCILGGAVGLLMVFVVLKGISSVIPFEMFLSFANMMVGLLASVIVGIISGVIPAFQASRMDPVEAIRA